MGGYAEAVWEAIHHGEEPPLRRDGGWIVIGMRATSAAHLRRMFPSVRRLLVVTGGDDRPEQDGVRFVRVRPGPPPSLPEAAIAAARDGFRSAVILDGVDETSGRLLLQLHRAGVRSVAWRTADGWRVGSARRALVRKPVGQLASGLRATRIGRWYRRRVERLRAHEALKRRNAQSFLGEAEWLAHLERVGVRAAPPIPADGALEIVLYIGQLGSGGAERQLCNLALALEDAGHDVTVLTTYPLVAEAAHFLDPLRRGGVAVRMAGERVEDEVRSEVAALEIDAELVGALPELVRDPVLDLAGELLADPPHVLHCWLDQPNIIGAAAAALVGTPHVLLSTRNVNPTHFPAFYRPWMDHWYAFLTPLPQVHLLANSHAGAEDYARWLGIAPSRFDVVLNGVDVAEMPAPTREQARAIREELGLGPTTPLVAGVFRLAPEKDPHLFLDVIARVRLVVPDLRVALVGDGPMRAEVEAAIETLGLRDVVAVLGRRRDVGAILGAADVMLLTSRVEGTPNVLLEAQWVGCPPVATAVGGTPDAVDHGRSGLLHRAGAAAGLAASVAALLDDRARREAFARAGRELVRTRFAVSRLRDETLAVYRRLLGVAPAGTTAEPRPVERTAETVTP